MKNEYEDKVLDLKLEVERGGNNNLMEIYKTYLKQQKLQYEKEIYELKQQISKKK